MYFKDLTKYEYHGDLEDSLNIGWLENGHLFNQGSVSEKFMDKLWGYLRYPVRIFRGFHTCDLCEKPNTGVPVVEYKGQKRKVGYYEMRVWGKDGNVYAAPSLIFHYILQHGYQPPQEFIDAVMDSENPDSDEYYQKVLAYSKGEDFWLAQDRTCI
ncbi:MAG: hypothetical protein K2O32_06940 [Acetatifactor sp.]|nr:hypothetical protein [Acetatifactor sp.]